MIAHNVFVAVSVRAVINCSLPLLHGLCIILCYRVADGAGLRWYILLLMLCRIAIFHRTNSNGKHVVSVYISPSNIVIYTLVGMSLTNFTKRHHAVRKVE